MELSEPDLISNPHVASEPLHGSNPKVISSVGLMKPKPQRATDRKTPIEGKRANFEKTPIPGKRSVWLLAAYHPETGEFEAWYTERSTMTASRERAVEYQMQEVADGTCNYLQSAPGYRVWIWVVEQSTAYHPLRSQSAPPTTPSGD